MIESGRSNRSVAILLAGLILIAFGAGMNLEDWLRGGHVHWTSLALSAYGFLTGLHLLRMKLHMLAQWA